MRPSERSDEEDNLGSSPHAHLRVEREASLQVSTQKLSYARESADRCCGTSHDIVLVLDEL